MVLRHPFHQLALNVADSQHPECVEVSAHCRVERICGVVDESMDGMLYCRRGSNRVGVIVGYDEIGEIPECMRQPIFPLLRTPGLITTYVSVKSNGGNTRSFLAESGIHRAEYPNSEEKAGNISSADEETVVVEVRILPMEQAFSPDFIDAWRDLRGSYSNWWSLPHQVLRKVRINLMANCSWNMETKNSSRCTVVCTSKLLRTITFVTIEV